MTARTRLVEVEEVEEAVIATTAVSPATCHAIARSHARVDAEAVEVAEEEAVAAVASVADKRATFVLIARMLEVVVAAAEVATEEVEEEAEVVLATTAARRDT